MALQKDFNTFLSNIEPSQSTVEYISSIQNNLRNYLAEHLQYQFVHVQTFLSGSYAKDTSIRPRKGDDKRDVDIVIETSYTESADSTDVIKELLHVLSENNKYKSAKLHSHSVGIELEGIEIDIVPVIKSKNGEKYYVGNSKVNEWTITDPKGHIKWSTSVNVENDKKYKPLVKMLKWWRRTNCPENIKYPKGLALEKIIADNIPNAEFNTETHFIGSMQAIVDAYKELYIDKGRNPIISDPCVDGNNLLDRYSFSDFKSFILKLSEHLELIEENGPTNEIWRKILGVEFPKASSEIEDINSTNVALNVQHRQKAPWNIIPKKSAVFISTKLKYNNGYCIDLENNGQLIPKNCSLTYRALHSIKSPYSVKWQIVNTGEEAKQNCCLRGSFEESNDGKNVRCESTSYSGKHYVQCFIIKNNSCVAKSKEFIINIE